MWTRYFKFFAIMSVLIFFLLVVVGQAESEQISEVERETVISLIQLNFEFEDLIGKKVWVSGFYGDDRFTGDGVGFLVLDFHMLLVNEKLPSHSFARLDGDLPPYNMNGAEMLVYGEVKNFAQTYNAFTLEPTPLITVEKHHILEPPEWKQFKRISNIKGRFFSFFTGKNFLQRSVAFAAKPTPKGKKAKKCDRALIISGGIDDNTNYVRYRDNVIAKYKGLKKLNFTDKQIGVLYNDGKAVNVKGKNIVDSKASRQKIKDILKKYEREMSSCCTLTIFVTDHGTGYNEAQGWNGARPDYSLSDPGGKTYPEKTFKIDLRRKVYRASGTWTTNGKLWFVSKDKRGRVEVHKKEGGKWVVKGFDKNGDGWITEPELKEDITGNGKSNDNLGWKVTNLETLLKAKWKYKNNEWDTDRDGKKDIRARWDGTKKRFVFERFKDKKWQKIGQDTNKDYIIDGGVDWNLDGKKNDRIGFYEGINLWGKEVLWDYELARMLKPLKKRGIHILMEADTCFGGGFVNNLKGIVEKIVTGSTEDTKHTSRIFPDGKAYASFEMTFAKELAGIDPESWNRAFTKAKKVDTDGWKKTSRRPNEKNEYSKWEMPAIPKVKKAKPIPTIPSPKKKEAKKKEGGIQYKKIKGKKNSCDVGILYKETPEGMDIEISAVATGKGADFRRWEVTDIKLNIDGNKIRPDKRENFYVVKESFFRGAATLVFAAIGSQYEQYADEAESGEVCPLEEEEEIIYEKEKGPIAKGIDKAGMAAGLGLLTSQARGDITGQKCTFSLDESMVERIDSEKDTIEISLVNKEKHQREKVKVPLKRLIAEIYGDEGAKKGP